MNHLFLINLQILCFLFFLTGCGDTSDGDKRLEEISGIQGQEAAERQVAEENKNLAQKAEFMEKDLLKRVKINDALSGDYRATLVVKEQRVNIEMSIQPNFIPATTKRIRTLEEITLDLAQVSLDILIKRYPDGSDVIYDQPCAFDSIMPDINESRLLISDSSCSSFYQLNFKHHELNPLEFSDKILEYTGNLKIHQLSGFVNVGASPGKFEIIFKRI